MKRIDLHVHTPYCGHATGSAEETIQCAIQRNFRILGFAEHFPYPNNYREPIPDCVVPGNRWDDYMEEIHRLRSTYADQLDIRIGAEVDYLPEYETAIKSRIESFDFDYVYGSIHLIDDIAIDYSDDYLMKHLDMLGGPDALWEKYWQGFENLIHLQICDILAHLDLPKKLKSARPSRDQTDGFRHILELMKVNERVLEINTGGIDRCWLAEPYPSRDILRHAAELGIEMTLGSDAHAPDQIGRHFDTAIDLLKAFGWDKIIVFKNRRKEYVNL